MYDLKTSHRRILIYIFVMQMFADLMHGNKC